jgi:hypothetical protein
MYMKEKRGKPAGYAENISEKDILSQKVIQTGVNTVGETEHHRAALETEDGKNNGAEPAAFHNKKKYQS